MGKAVTATRSKAKPANRSAGFSVFVPQYDPALTASPISASESLRVQVGEPEKGVEVEIVLPDRRTSGIVTGMDKDARIHWSRG